ncbi:Chitin synthase, class 3 [Yamadazyma tenuis]|uniref:chitin synthase n=1 Tax=Candida tenuis (strain ATCC 10573 / BCRC 21748 / CBS 615 / JCM 9827 / NBRC 10315 / NRRL Y-1498 / VKM Y-70) TaxID=590646 RepID=G3AZT6_CANTC|nr:uncharacterized protein CANTEDRAFT_119349 [Yamadazyma tenuis ATCC 10573]EGV65238.1 hypothetical protein CANTEDRAFT_119349 [Yamadazyma tenuis ATCC 10573]WEJ95111.1 Chitin synthase, class 3 [Yamadazyma tenuis]
MSFRNSTNSKNYQEFDPEAGELGRKRSLVRPERSRIDQSHPRYHYTQVTNQQSDHLKVQPSSTGLDPQVSNHDSTYNPRNSFHSYRTLNSKYPEEQEGIPLMDYGDENKSNTASPHKGGTEVFGLNDEVEYSPHKKDVIKKNSLKRRSMTNHDNRESDGTSMWRIYCYIITFWAPSPLLYLFGLKSKERQFAWREKIALISVILYIGTFVAYLTFGFTKTVCSKTAIRTRINEVNSGYLIINGRSFDLTKSQHPGVAGIDAGSNILYPPTNAGGKDASLLFQNVNGNCKGLIKPRDNCTIPTKDTDEVAWYMPCKLLEQDGSSQPNFTTEYYDGWACHTSSDARNAYYNLKVTGDVYFTWGDINNSSRNLVVYSGNVLDLDLINWIQSDDLEYPTLFDRLRDEEAYKGHDISLVLSNSDERHAARCLTEIIKVGTIDSDTIGCIASQVVLIVSLVFILSVVVAKFLMACYFKWFISLHQGATDLNSKSMESSNKSMENWVDDDGALQRNLVVIPSKMRADYKTNRQSVFKRMSLTPNEMSQYYINSENLSKNFKYTTMGTQNYLMANKNPQKTNASKRQSTMFLNETFNSSTDLLNRQSTVNPFDIDDFSTMQGLSPDIIHPDVVPQPPVEYQPYGFPLAHTMCLVTCYSEDDHEIRITLDSVAVTNYPNSHKLIVVICDGLVKGSGNEETTPDIVLGMMTDFVVQPEEVQPYSYVAVAQGSKRHNMAKVYGGFYKYDDSTVPPENQQRVPIITIVKCGTPEEANLPKPGNRGKRDTQVVLMSFLQKVMFDERMTGLEFQMLQTIWQITGLMPEMYEITLMVDADTKVHPDSLTHMVAEMVKDPAIMGLCGETKIANKNQSWVTLIQVFEYYISHHQSKAFESVFGGVTCLPGCFCMYRIKSPKGSDGFWVPILSNPDIVERYSDNITKSLHRKNLLLLGEDRYLSSLMLRTFPKRKQIFVPKAVCRTVVPNKFSVLLSQRRRWINSTVHNLMELVLVRDLCGTFCFSMNFSIFIELVGTVVLPAAICFTIYVIVYAATTTPTPVLSLVLLALIFGLPGLLIVITVSSFQYLVYFVIYLFALPIWNFVLPTYSFWKFDDFSWGETRQVGSEDKGSHGDLEGVFDSSHIVMKRWREFERDRKNEGLTMPSATWNPSNTNLLNDSFSN